VVVASGRGEFAARLAVGAGVPVPIPAGIPISAAGIPVPVRSLPIGRVAFILGIFVFVRGAVAGGPVSYTHLDVYKRQIVRWLTLEQNRDDIYKTVGKRQSGSGFVVGEQGFILTNKHVAAGWASRYDDFRIHDWSDGVIYDLGDRPRYHKTQRVSDVNSLTGWVPESGGYVFEASNPRLISDCLLYTSRCV